jgi:hypothetical protein
MTGSIKLSFLESARALGFGEWVTMQARRALHSLHEWQRYTNEFFAGLMPNQQKISQETSKRLNERDLTGLCMSVLTECNGIPNA